ncbi:MAG TPA: hypothetical protein VJ875_05940 [Pyrinomonadaceae bacterium]|nr:hypothetical protein [Pyrinomonadaceae bacterium]
MAEQVEKSVRLRIGLIIDSLSQPRWVRRCLEKIAAANVANFVVVVKLAPAEKPEGSLLYKLYNRLDRSAFSVTPDALEQASIDDLVDGSPSLSSDELEKIRTFELDVLLNFGPTEWNAKFAQLAKYGVWFYAFGNDENSLPGLREVMTQDPVMISSLRSLSGQPPTEQIIYQSTSPTLHRFSLRLNNNYCYWKSAAFVARSLVDLHESHDVVALDVSHTGNGSVEQPTNATMGQLFLKLSGRAASRVLEKLSSFEQWVLAYRIHKGDFQYLIPPVDRFWADPFPIKVGEQYYIFFEEYLNSAGRAHLSVIQVDQTGIVSGPAEVLKLDCHLSYPFVFEWRGDYYMIPETGDKNVVSLYRSASFPFDWQLEQVLLEATCPLDATLVEVDGTWWMFVNIQEEGVLVNWDELHVYYADSPHGPWKPHARNPVISDVTRARPAGNLFWLNDVLYRPSQDSSMRYGYATTISRIDNLSPTEYSETEVAKILPDWDKDVIGVHTLNKFDEITVIDCFMKRRRFRARTPRPPVLTTFGPRQD